MARTVNLAKRIEKIKAQLDDLSAEIKSGGKRDEAFVEPKVKLSNIDFETEDLGTLVKIQGRLARIIQSKVK